MSRKKKLNKDLTAMFLSIMGCISIALGVLLVFNFLVSRGDVIGLLSGLGIMMSSVFYFATANILIYLKRSTESLEEMERISKGQ